MNDREILSENRKIIRRRFMGSMQAETTSKRIGIAEGKFAVPDDFDACNDEIAEMFGAG